jgi:hypothetical protein
MLSSGLLILIRLICGHGLVRIQWTPDKEAVECNTLVYHFERFEFGKKDCKYSCCYCRPSTSKNL